MHGDTVLYPLADIKLVEVILGTDASRMTELLGRRAGSVFCAQEHVMVVTTRAKRRQEIQEEVLRKEKEVMSGVVPNPLGVSKEEPKLKTMSQEQRRQMRRELVSQGDCLSHINITAEKLKDLHLEQDETLRAVRELAALTGGSKGEFFKRDELLYRRWTPRGRGEEMEIEQLVLPKECRQVALEMSHDIPIAGHQGRDRTRQRLLRRFFWPSIFRDVDMYCKTCSACQKASFKGVKPAPLIPLPIVSEPFSRIAMDIVGPLPRSRAGNKYILVICDYTRRRCPSKALMLKVWWRSLLRYLLVWVYPGRS